jgi:hypothetical protein
MWGNIIANHCRGGGPASRLLVRRALSVPTTRGASARGGGVVDTNRPSRESSTSKGSLDLLRARFESDALDFVRYHHAPA